MMIPNAGLSFDQLINMLSHAPLTPENIAKVIDENNKVTTSRLRTALESLENDFSAKLEKASKSKN